MTYFQKQFIRIQGINACVPGFFHRLHSYVYVGIIVLGVSAIAGLAVFLTSHKPYPPKYQWVSPRSIHTLRQDHKGTCISGP
jgi:hypothetical protein